MKTITLRICPTAEANRDKSILENHGVRAVVVPHYKAPSFYVGDTRLTYQDCQSQGRKIVL